MISKVKPLTRISCLILLFLVVSISTTAQDSIWVTYMSGGMRALERGNYGDAEKLFRAAIREAAKAKDSGNKKAVGMMLDSLEGLGGALRGQKRYADAERVVRESLQLLEMATTDSDPKYSLTLNNLGLLLTEEKKFKEAEETHRKALTLREKYDGPPRRNFAVSLLNLGVLLYEQGDVVESEPFFNQARGILSKIPIAELTQSDFDNILMCDHNLGLIYTEQKKYDDAELRFKAAIAFTEKLKGENHPDLILYLQSYANLLRLINRAPLAARVEARIKRIRDGMR